MTVPPRVPPADPLRVAAGERGILRLFALDMPAEQLRFLAEPGAVAQMLGAEDLDLDPDQIDLIAPGDLAGVGLGEYLTEGFAIPRDQIDQAVLQPLTGHLLLIRSRAFRGRAATLHPARQLTLIATYGEPATDWHAAPVKTASARSRIPPRAARSQARRIGLALFSGMMLLIAALVIWIAT